MKSPELIETFTIPNFPDRNSIWKWWKTQERRFQTEQGEQKQTMVYQKDLPEIIQSFVTHFRI
jgi:hypothetical protein